MNAVRTRTHVATRKVAGILEAVTDVPVRQDITWMMIKELAKVSACYNYREWRKKCSPL
jgi:hypothetical protein